MYKTIVKLPLNNFYLDGDLSLPVRAQSLVIFSHGSGSSRTSPRNKMMAKELNKAGYGTLLFDLVGNHKKKEYAKRFDLEVITRRLASITLWLYNHSEFKDFDLGFLGLGTGAASAMQAAARLNSIIKALVSYGGRTDLIEADALKDIHCPVFFIAGELDFHTLKLNRATMKELNCAKQFMVVPGATLLIEEPVKMELATKGTISWFNKYLRTYEMNSSLAYDLPGTD